MWTKYQQELCGDPPLSANKEWHTEIKTDRRKEEFEKCKKKYGFYPYEVWELDHEIVCYILPRLQYFRDNTIVVPTTYKDKEEYKKVLDKYIQAFKDYLSYGDWEYLQIKEGNFSVEAANQRYEEITDTLAEFMKNIGMYWD